MKVLLVNGSPRKNGCTYTALAEIAGELEKESVGAEIFHIGAGAIAGCAACGFCFEAKRCATDDGVNEFLEKAKEADGFIFGSPVYFASFAGSLSAFLDRAFYVGRGTVFPHKPAAAIVSCRRGGASAALDGLNKYITISQMPLITSRYWNMVHGNTPDEVRQDLEGMMVMRGVGRNMAWVLKCIEAGKKAGVKMPEQETAVRTNFIR